MLHRELRTAWIEIDLDNFDSNIKAVLNYIGKRKLIGIVKGDAYGHGAVPISQVFLRNGVTHLAVATLEEALELRDAGIKAPVFMLGLVPEELTDYLVRYDLIPLVSSKENIAAVSKEAVRQEKIISVFVAVDTGMGRIGFLPGEEAELAQALSLPGIRLEGIMSHFSSADMEDLDYSYSQIGIFDEFCAKLEELGIVIPMRSLANSPALYRLKDSLYDAVRPSAMTYGFYPDNVSDEEKKQIPIVPVMSVKTKIIHLKKVAAGTAISYGRKFATSRESVIATLPMGYADGLTRKLQGDRIRVLVHEKSAPILGTICMDQCMIDVTDIPNVKIGDIAVILGQQGNECITTAELCDIADLCSGELWFRFAQRLPRVFVSKGCK
jgi:alanine racemase